MQLFSAIDGKMGNRFSLALLSVFCFILPFQGIFMLDSKWFYPVKYALLVLLWVILFFKLIRRPVPMPDYFWWLLGLPVLFGLASLPSLIFNPSDLRGYSEVVLTILSMSIGSLLVGLLVTEKDMEIRIKVLILSLLAGIGSALVLSMIFYFFDFRWLIPQSHYEGIESQGRLYGIFNNPVALSIFAFSSMLISILALQQKWIVNKVGLFALGVSIFGMLTAVTKATYVGGGVSVMLMICLAYYFRMRWQKHLWLKVVAIFFIALVVAIGSVIWKLNKEAEQLGNKGVNISVASLLRVQPDMAQTGSRPELWRAGIEVIKEHWLVGIGKNKINWSNSLAANLPSNRPAYLAAPISPHNGLLEVWGGLGILGLMLYICLPLALIYGISRGGTLNVYGIFFISLLIYYLIREQLDLSSLYTYSADGMLFWSLTGMFFAGALHHQIKPTEEK